MSGKLLRSESKSSMLSRRLAIVGAVCMGCLALTSARVWADIRNWQTGQTIPGTEGITPGPGISLADWNSDDHNLRYAEFSGGLDLTGSIFERSWLNYAKFTNANLGQASFWGAVLTGADMTDAVVTGTNFGPFYAWGSPASGFTKEQLYSTASYKAKDLQGIGLGGIDLSGWNFAGQNLTGANFESAKLTGADLTDAVVTGVSFRSFYPFPNSGFTKIQLYSTASYKVKDLQGIGLWGNDLAGWNFAGQNLNGADLRNARLGGADLTDAVVTGADFYGTTGFGFRKEQLYSTASYKSKDLHHINLVGNDLSSWNFAGQNLTEANFSETTLTNANLTDAVVTGAHFGGRSTRGFTKEQLYSTANYKAKDLQGIGLWDYDFSGWNFAGQNLMGAHFEKATLRRADLSRSNLANAMLTDTDLTDAVVTEANFSGAYGFTNEQLYSTATYKARNLQGIVLKYQNLSDCNLAGQNLTRADLTNASFANGILSGADLTDAVVTESNFSGITGLSKEQLYATASYKTGNLRGLGLEYNDLSGWNFAGQNLSAARFSSATLTGADLTDAVVTDANFSRSSGFTKEQLYSTASYRVRNLRGIGFEGQDLSGWNFVGQSLSAARFSSATLTGADLTDAVVSEANFSSTPSFTKEQLYSTASYKVKDLHGIGLEYKDLSGWNLAGQSLSCAVLTGADLTDAVVIGASFAGATGLTSDQLYSTASYKAKDLHGVGLDEIDLSGWSFQGQNLREAKFSQASLVGADLTDAVVIGADFRETTARGFTREQLYATSSYKSQDLRGISLAWNNLSGWNLGGQDLTGATFVGSTLTGADLTNAKIAGADFSKSGWFGSIGTGLVAVQLYSTASYKDKDLRGIGLRANDLSGWNFAGQNLAAADFGWATLTNALLSFADVRGSSGADLSSAITHNTILPDGTIAGLYLRGGDVLTVRDYDAPEGSPAIPIHIVTGSLLEQGSKLQILLCDESWGSTISFEAGITVTLGGNLELLLAPGAELGPLLGHSFRLFDWTGVSPEGKFSLVTELPVDASRLYSEGVVTLVPEPGALLAVAAAGMLLRHRRGKDRRGVERG